MHRILVATLGIAGSLAASSTPKYPFPYQADYAYGIRVSPVPATPDIQANFAAWKATYYLESPDATKARIVWLDPTAASEYNGSCDMWKGSCTVSEGIGYGMLIAVYMDNATNQTQSMFDKLWAYYQAYPDGNGLMNWKINGFSGTASTGAATDADVDVALALSMAYKQWGDSKYLTGAQTQLGHIWAKEVNSSSNLLTPDDQGTANLYDPSYFSTGALRVFPSVDNTSSHGWAKVADACLAFIAKNQNSTTGLVSDWTNGNANPVSNQNSGNTAFGYDAVRTPWRMALDYYWFGTMAAQANLNKIGNWITSSTGGNVASIRADYNLDGTNDNTRNAIYTGAMLMATIGNPADTAWIRQGYATLNLANYWGWDGNYYNKNWKILDLLALSGNFQDFWGTVKPSGLFPVSAAIQDWSASTRPGFVDLRGRGTVRAQLLDLSGRILSQSSGVDRLSLPRPTGEGVLLVRILGEHPRTLSVAAN
jgi:endo-1,4-beta-D-glucanase Y